MTVVWLRLGTQLTRAVARAVQLVGSRQQAACRRGEEPRRDDKPPAVFTRATIIINHNVKAPTSDPSLVFDALLHYSTKRIQIERATRLRNLKLLNHYDMYFLNRRYKNNLVRGCVYLFKSWILFLSLRPANQQSLNCRESFISENLSITHILYT